MIFDNPQNDTYPLTHPQKRIWYIEKINQLSQLHNIGGTVRFKGAIDLKLLERSIIAFIKNNQGVRLILGEKDNQPFQYVLPSEKIPDTIDFFDFSGKKHPEESFLKTFEHKFRTPFKLLNEPLFYFALFKVNDTDMGYFLKFHHIICDGWSIMLLTSQIMDSYKKMSIDENNITQEKNPDYLDYIVEEDTYLTSARFERNKQFWKDSFSTLPDNFSVKNSNVGQGQRKNFLVDTNISIKLKKFLKEQGFSLNSFFTSVLLIYLYKTTGSNDLIIGVPVLNRSGKKVKHTVGMYTSSMPFRIKLKENCTALNFLKTVSRELKVNLLHQKYPYDLLAKDIGLRKQGLDVLFNICVNYYNTRHSTEYEGIPIENDEFYNGSQMYSLQLIIKEWLDSNAISLSFDYKKNDYNSHEIDTCYSSFLSITKKIISFPQVKLNQLSLVDEQEKQQLIYTFNNRDKSFPHQDTITGLFEKQCLRTPQNTALSHNGKRMSYEVLNEKANQLSHFLIEKKIGRNSCVAIIADHSIELIIGILGILKCGAWYVPISPDLPKKRISIILQEVNAPLILTNRGISGLGPEILNLDNPLIYRGNCASPETKTLSSDPAYCIFTSGSTGKPKGVLVRHSSLVNYVTWASKTYIKDDNEVFALFTSIAFDLTVTSIFTPLISGARINIYSESANDTEYVLYRIIKDNEATVIKLTPSQLSLLTPLDNSGSSVKRFILGGEDLKVSLAHDIHNKFQGNVEIFNEYGPTEATVGCMIHKYDAKSDRDLSVPIGCPIDNSRIYILDNTLLPLPVGKSGQLYIGGSCLAAGYVNSPELSREKFIENPFVPGEKIYKTGDKAKFTSYNSIVYEGRMDNQVKINGYRIEMGEIEKYLLKHQKVNEALVIKKNNENGNDYLCAYITGEQDITPFELQNFLKEYLPSYMIPGHILYLKEFSLNQNGKIDKKQLPEPEDTGIKDIESSTPQTEHETVLTKIIKKVLNIDILDRNSNFFHIGGDSINAIQIASLLNEKKLEIKIKDILSNPEIKHMAAKISKKQEKTDCEADNRANFQGSIKNTPIISWFFTHQLNNPDHFNQSVFLELKINIKAQDIEDSLNVIISHHDSLRLNYNREKGSLFYNEEHLHQRFSLETYDLSSCSPDEQKIKMSELGSRIKSAFSIENTFLFNACLFITGSKNMLLLTAHHLIIDGISWRILLEDITTLLKQRLSQKQMALPAKTHSYKVWADRLYNHFEQRELAHDREYWQSLLSSEKKLTIKLEEESVENNCQKPGITTIKDILPEEQTNLLLKKGNALYNTKPDELLLIALALTIGDLDNSREVFFEIDAHGRDILSDININRTVGWFTSLYPVKISLEKNHLSNTIKSIKEQLRNSNLRKSSYGFLRHIENCFNTKETKYIRFNYLGNFDNAFTNEYFTISTLDSGPDLDQRNQLNCLFEINTFLLNRCLHIDLSYNSLYKKKESNRFYKMFKENLNNLAKHCLNQDKKEFTPSDFDLVQMSQIELDMIFA